MYHVIHRIIHLIDHTSMEMSLVDGYYDNSYNVIHLVGT